MSPKRALEDGGSDGDNNDTVSRNKSLRLQNPQCDDLADSYVHGWLKTVSESEAEPEPEPQWGNNPEPGLDVEPGHRSDSYSRSRSRSRSASQSDWEAQSPAYETYDPLEQREALRAPSVASDFSVDPPTPDPNAILREREHPFRWVLETRNVWFRPAKEALPEKVESLVHRVLHTDRSSPEPTEDDLFNDWSSLESLFQGEYRSEACEYFKSDILKDKDLSGILKRISFCPITRHLVPSSSGKYEDCTPELKTPRPDCLYGYDQERAFSDEAHQAYFKKRFLNINANPLASISTPNYPFLTVSFLGTKDSQATALNKCLNAASACVNMAEIINDAAQGQARVDITVFAIAMSGNEVRLYAAWQHDNADGGNGPHIYS